MSDRESEWTFSDAEEFKTDMRELQEEAFEAGVIGNSNELVRGTASLKVNPDGTVTITTSCTFRPEKT